MLLPQIFVDDPMPYPPKKGKSHNHAHLAKHEINTVKKRRKANKQARKSRKVNTR